MIATRPTNTSMYMFQSI